MLSVLGAFTLTNCGPASAPSGGESSATRVQPDQQTLVLLLRGEPKTQMPRLGTITEAGVLQGDVPRLFNAGLAIADPGETPHPYLAESLPQLSTDSWRLFPDGRMETTYRLRPRLTWHDGRLLTPQDFQFALRVSKDPEFGGVLFKPEAERFVDEILALDEHTILIRWAEPFREAGALPGVWAFPRHLIEEAYRRGDRDAFAAHPYFRDEYVGLGPYRMTRWEFGVSIEGEAFRGHALGPPKIPRVRVVWAEDHNAALVRLLAGAVHFVESTSQALSFQQGLILKREWDGNLLFVPATLRYIWVQHRPEYANPGEIRDLRVRKALLHATDRLTIVDALQDGEGGVADAFVYPLVAYYRDVDSVITKYPFDLRRAEQLLAEARFTKNRDGFYGTASGTLFSPQLRAVSAATGSVDEREQAVLVDLWRRAGVAVEPSVLPLAESRNAEVLSTFRAFNNGSTAVGATWNKFQGDYIAGPENRWARSNRGGWFNAEYDRLLHLFEQTLDLHEGYRIRTEMLKLLGDELPGLPLYYTAGVTGFARGLHGPVIGGGIWDVHLWEWQ
jgi:peptide/nickel transport system substrate-binding protein